MKRSKRKPSPASRVKPIKNAPQPVEHAAVPVHLDVQSAEEGAKPAPPVAVQVEAESSAGPAEMPLETNSPLTVNPDTVLALAVASQSLTTISWQGREVSEVSRCL